MRLVIPRDATIICLRNYHRFTGDRGGKKGF